jgi:dTDP-4-dehydrorhamnose 3,5-epimerase
VELSADTGRQLYVPVGFLHGFSTLTAFAEVQYKCTDFYAPSADGSVAWNSPSLGIDWRLDDEPELSAKDRAAPDFAHWTTPFEGETTR